MRRPLEASWLSQLNLLFGYGAASQCAGESKATFSWATEVIMKAAAAADALPLTCPTHREAEHAGLQRLIRDEPTPVARHTLARSNHSPVMTTAHATYLHNFS